MKEKFLSKRALIIEALLAVYLLNYLFGFEITVLATLAVITANVFNMAMTINGKLNNQCQE